ncbi:MAG: hypothetical protein ACK5IN_00800, partial [Microbacterium sp.]|uniref:hypothetical protein n=1 Tax=Microbacterium sp. TaxID=51671 RepID=UPI003A874ECD
GELRIDTFEGFDDMGIAEDERTLVLHAQITTPAGLTLMASDTPSSMPYQDPAGHSVSLSGDDEAELQGYWDALLDGGTVVLPFVTPHWGGRVGMLKGRFGIDWMLALNAADAQNPDATTHTATHTVDGTRQDSQQRV